MIEQPLKNYIKNALDNDMYYTINYSSVNDNIVTVYSESGERPSSYKGVLIKPNYQVLIKSSNFEKAYNVADKIYNLLHQLQDIIMTVQLEDRELNFKVYSIEALHLPARLGVDEDEIMSYSINFQTYIKEIKHVRE